MFLKNITIGCATIAVMSVPAITPVKADSGDFAAGIVAGVIGSAVVRNANKPKQNRTVRRTTTRSVKRSNVNTAQRAENREVQTSLNYFGFPAGAPDGVFGRKTRASVSAYQAHLGYPATGQLTQYEKDFLLQSYRRAIAGGAVTTQQIAANPLGPRGLLNLYRDQAAGVVTATAPAVQPVPGTAALLAVQPQVLPLQGGTTTTTTTTVSAGAAAPATGGAALPNFLGTSETVSLASHCNQVSLITSTNGGFTTEANLVDASFALNEQFCLARTYAIAEGEKLIASVQGFTPQQIEQQCAGFGPALAPHVAALSLKPADKVSADVAKFVLDSGMAPAQLAGTAKICLSVGYRTDDLDVAVGSALLLSILGQQAYGELLGHHLAKGFGVTQRVDLATAWYDMGLTAVEQGATPVFNPGDAGRSALLRKAVFAAGTSQSQLETQPVVQPVGSALPTFNIQN